MKVSKFTHFFKVGSILISDKQVNSLLIKAEYAYKIRNECQNPNTNNRNTTLATSFMCAIGIKESTGLYTCLPLPLNDRCIA